MIKILNNPLQVKGYSQGGTVVDGIAYFSACLYQEKLEEDGCIKHMDKPVVYPYVVAFDVKTLEIIRTYPFENTYDSTPLVVQKKDGTWLILAHEYENARTVAMIKDTSDVVWISEANQLGKMFLGYSYYKKKDGTKLILASCQNGLHAMSLENGKDQWVIPSVGGVTPCVDQEGGYVYFQSSGSLFKIEAETGVVMETIRVERPSSCVSWNTVLANDGFGYHIVTYWYSPNLFGSAIRVYDVKLNMEWEQKGLPMSKKATLTYHNGKIFIGCGDHWQKKQYLGLEDDHWKKIRAYNINSGKVEWELDLRRYNFACLPNIIYCNGLLIAETQTNISNLGYLILVISASDGVLLKEYYRELPANSCGVPAFTNGRLFSGDLVTDSILVTEIGPGTKTDWVGAFGNGQTNDMCAPDHALQSLNRMNIENMR